MRHLGLLERRPGRQLALLRRQLRQRQRQRQPLLLLLRHHVRGHGQLLEPGRRAGRVEDGGQGRDGRVGAAGRIDLGLVVHHAVVELVGVHLDALLVVGGAAAVVVVPAQVAQRLQELALQAVAAVEGFGLIAAHGQACTRARGGRAGGEASLLQLVFEGAVFEGGAVEEVATVFAGRDHPFERGGGAGGLGGEGGVGRPEVGVAAVGEEGFGGDDWGGRGGVIFPGAGRGFCGWSRRRWWGWWWEWWCFSGNIRSWLLRVEEIFESWVEGFGWVFVVVLVSSPEPPHPDN